MTPRIQIRRVVCAVDFSEPSRAAFDHALALTRWFEAKMTIAHVVPVMAALPDPAYPAGLLPAITPERALQELDRLAGTALGAGVASSVVLLEGDPVRQILELGRKVPADLLVMGTHGLRGFERLMLGSVSEAVLRKATCPVLTVSRACRPSVDPRDRPFRKVLCALDLKAASARTLMLALSLAQETDASLTLLHVVEGPDGGVGSNAHFDVPEYRGYLASEAREKLQRAVPAEARDWCDVGEFVTIGEASQEILELAKKRDADLIVMGAHGPNPIDLLFFGSTARRVVRDASCPVLTIPSRMAAVSAVQTVEQEEFSWR
jgi:nucleotide-binding universal stress UspA family protein